jgi:hypothetical protein
VILITLRLQRAQQLDIWDAEPAVHAADERLLKEIGEPRTFGGAVCSILQFHPHSFDVAGYASDGGRREDRLWDVSDIVSLVEAEEANADRKRGPYKTRGEVA